MIVVLNNDVAKPSDTRPTKRKGPTIPMTRSDWRTRSAAALTGVAMLAATFFIPATAANAEAGAPPASITKRVLQNVHTDAVSTFLDGTVLELGTKADVDGGLGQRLDPASTIFNVGDSSKTTIPAGFDFIAPAGSDVWLASESSPRSDENGYTQIWPGFSTESVPVGGVDGDQTTFTLTDIAMPDGASVELWRGGAFGAPTRMWSTDEGISAFTIGRTHMHANWAFTEPGSYTFTVTATATIAGTAVTSTAPYTFVVGAVAPAATTTTTLAAPAALVVGDAAKLTATITPAEATGWVEFFDGDVSLGHTAVDAGTATLTTSTLPIGTRGITARYNPVVSNDFVASTSPTASISVTATPDSGVFGLSGHAASYTSGSNLDVRAVNATLGAGETYRWIIRKAPVTTTYLLADIGDAASTGHLVRPLDSSYDGSEIMVQVRGIDPATGRAVTKASSAYYPISVTGPDVGSGEPVVLAPIAAEYRTGDNVTLAIDSRDLAEGESFHLMTRNPRTSVAWIDSYFVPTGEQPWRVPADVLSGIQSSVQLRSADGTVLGQTAPFAPNVVASEILLSGVQNVYRAGDTATASVEVYPARDDVSYTWAIDANGAYTEIEGQTGPTVSFPVTADLDGGRLYVDVVNTELDHPWGTASAPLTVTDAAPGEQLLFFSSLAGHYHQGNTIALELVADPVIADGDTVAWSWKLPGQSSFTPVPGATGLTHALVAEQALDGAEVRATLAIAGGATVDAKPVTIHVDDHGAPATQKVTIGGAADEYTVGDRVALSAAVSPASVLSRIEWLVQKAGDDAPVAVAGENGAQYTFAATSALDGAAVIARLTYDDGSTYVESAPKLLAVKERVGEPTPEVPSPEVPVPVVPVPENPQQPAPVLPETPTVPETPGVPATPAEPLVPQVPDSPEPPAPGRTAPGSPLVTLPADSTPVAPSPRGPAAQSSTALDGVRAGGIAVSDDEVRVGSVVTIDLGAGHANTAVAAWMFSTPVLLGSTWTQVDASGRIAVMIPADAAPGVHRIAVFDATNTLVGFQQVTVLDASGRLAETGYGLGAAPLFAGVLLLLAGIGITFVARSRRAGGR